MRSPVFQDESFSVPMSPLITHCPIFQTAPTLLARPDKVESRVSVDSFRTFVSAIGGTEPDITGDNAADLTLLSDTFGFAALATSVADWRAAHPAQGADTKLIAASLEEWLQSQDRALHLFDRRVHRLRPDAIEDERAKVTHAAKNIGPAAEQRRAVAREMCALEGEIGGFREAIRAELKEDLVRIDRGAKDGQQQPREREPQSMGDVRNVVGRLEAVVEENSRQVLTAAAVRRGKGQWGAELGGLKLRVGVLERDFQGDSKAKESRPQSREARRLSGHLGELIAVVGLRGGGGSPPTGGLSARGLANVAVRDCSDDDFTFIVGDHRYRCRSCIA
jgi:hypothetical protein